MEIDGVSYDVWSLSARRAWIEIFLIYHYICKEVVALRKESVDRNLQEVMIMSISTCRSPQGERG